MLATALVAGIWLAPALPIVLVAGAVVAARRPLLGVAIVIALIGGAARADQAWQAAATRRLGEFSGWARLVGDQVARGPGVRVTLEIDGERFDAWVYGSSRRRLENRDAGEWVQVSGRRSALGANARRAQVRHVVGRFEVRYVADSVPGSALDRTCARVRGALRRSAEATMPAQAAALFTGLVVGDDSRQPPTMVRAFRDAGLSHLTAVSGQNLAYAIAAAGPLLRRLRAWWRWAATLAVIGWFMALTRFEPSVLRAGLMAMLSATVFVLGGRASPLRLLALAVLVLVTADPLLVWSVGFWLSVGATWGVAVLGPRLSVVLPGPPWIRHPFGVTLGAQIGVAVPSLLVFGRLPLVSLPANLLAVPVAGFVMLYGIPAAAIGDTVLPARGPAMFPAALATRWVELVADLAARLQPPRPVAVAGWLLVVTYVALRLWASPAGDVPG